MVVLTRISGEVRGGGVRLHGWGTTRCARDYGVGCGLRGSIQLQGESGLEGVATPMNCNVQELVLLFTGPCQVAACVTQFRDEIRRSRTFKLFMAKITLKITRARARIA